MHITSVQPLAPLNAAVRATFTACAVQQCWSPRCAAEALGNLLTYRTVYSPVQLIVVTQRLLQHRYMAKKTGLMGGNDKEAALVDMVIEGVEVSLLPAVLTHCTHLCGLQQPYHKQPGSLHATQ